jgi:hypothetical protein
MGMGSTRQRPPRQRLSSKSAYVNFRGSQGYANAILQRVVKRRDEILGIRAQISFFKPACLLSDRIVFLIIEGAIQYCVGNWRGFGWQSEAIQNLLDRCRRIDRAQDSHPSAAAIAFQNVQPKKTQAPLIRPFGERTVPRQKLPPLKKWHTCQIPAGSDRLLGIAGRSVWQLYYASSNQSGAQCLNRLNAE